ncbi:DUF1214 domain-containing protein [Pseudomonas pohangensis]|uniref:DUF1214 domain-containing protein n=1 Tax=Pseudomonas pohangensis TaxID=364197 RepID=UPI0018D4B110|nr:DUF1214 domain-containing protein [Pseudomonas pohangensis]
MTVPGTVLPHAEGPQDLDAANAMQGKLSVRQKNAGRFEIPDQDEASLKKVRDAINLLVATRTGTRDMFGDKAKLDPISHFLGTAMGWSGNPEQAARYDSAVPEMYGGKTLYRLTVKDVPVAGFWSITVYNESGYMEKNDQNSYTYNHVTARKNADASITINFGGGPDVINNLRRRMKLHLADV